MKFEDKMKKLESIITELEGNNSDLENSIDKYNEAMKLIKDCDEQLKDIETNINKIVLENGELEDLKVEE